MVKKNRDIKADPQENHALEYDDHRDIACKMYADTEMTNRDLDLLITEINKLTAADHLNIYILLRKQGIDKSFFSRSKKATHFDIDKLPNELKWRLQMYVKFTQENNARNKKMETADQQFQTTMTRLNERLKPTKQSGPGTGPESDNESGLPQQTETDKYERMLQLNKSI